MNYSSLDEGFIRYAVLFCHFSSSKPCGGVVYLPCVDLWVEFIDHFSPSWTLWTQSVVTHVQSWSWYFHESKKCFGVHTERSFEMILSSAQWPSLVSSAFWCIPSQFLLFSPISLFSWALFNVFLSLWCILDILCGTMTPYTSLQHYQDTFSAVIVPRQTKHNPSFRLWERVNFLFLSVSRQWCAFCDRFE